MKRLLKLSKIIVLVIAVIFFAVALSSIPIIHHYQSILSEDIDIEQFAIILEEVHKEHDLFSWKENCGEARQLDYKYRVPCENFTPDNLNKIAEYIFATYGTETYYKRFNLENMDLAVTKFILPALYLILILSTFTIVFINIKSKQSILIWLGVAFFLSASFFFLINLLLFLYYSSGQVLESVSIMVLNFRPPNYFIGTFYFLITILITLIYSEHKKKR